MTQKTKMTTNETIPDEIFVCENCGCPTKTAAWTLDKYPSCCPERKPVMRKIVDADTVSAAVREVDQAIANQTKTMRGIAALIAQSGSTDFAALADYVEGLQRENSTLRNIAARNATIAECGE